VRPLTAGELLDAAFSAVRRNFGALAMCTLVAVVPVSILSTLVEASTTDSAFDYSSQTTIERGEVGAYVAGTVVTSLLSLIAFSLATAACLRAVGGDIVGRKISAGESLGFAFERLGALLWVALLSLLALIAGLPLCLVGSIWLGVMFSLATPALLFEDHHGVAAMRRSRDLIKDNWWRVFGVLVVMYLIVFVIQGVLIGALAAVILTSSENEVLNAVLVTAGNIVAYALTLPLGAALTTYIYFDLRVRKEGFDIQLLAERIGQGGSAAPASSGVAGLPADEGGGGFLPPRPPGG
jgi:hypothetical protein